MHSQKVSVALTAALAIFTTTLLVTGTPAVAQEKVLHSFGNGKDGATPWGGVIFDSAGNLYGTTFAGGTGPCSTPQAGCGTIFELSPKAGGSWTEKVVHNFHGNDGWEPSGNLIIDGAGNLYGTTRQGGTGLCRYLSTEDHYLIGCGTVFELSPAAGGAWTEKVLYSFINNGTDGNEPAAGLVFDAAGNLYGTTFNGGPYDYGTVFELSPAGGGSWTETVLHNFNANGTDGADPWASLVFDGAGNLYGTTVGGGMNDNGVVFELTHAGGTWTETIVHDCNGSTDGYYPEASLIFHGAGNLYGTTSSGGAGGVDAEGSVFELSPAAGGSWAETILHNFNENGTDAAAPVAGVIFDATGNLYGTTQYGGPRNVYGTVFELMPAAGGGYSERILHDFGTGTDGVGPEAGLVFDAAGHLYGTTTSGGVYGYGTVFEVAH